METYSCSPRPQGDSIATFHGSEPADDLPKPTPSSFTAQEKRNSRGLTTENTAGYAVADNNFSGTRCFIWYRTRGPERDSTPNVALGCGTTTSQAEAEAPPSGISQTQQHIPALTSQTTGIATSQTTWTQDPRFAMDPPLRGPPYGMAPATLASLPGTAPTAHRPPAPDTMLQAQWFLPQAHGIPPGVVPEEQDPHSLESEPKTITPAYGPHPSIPPHTPSYSPGSRFPGYPSPVPVQAYNYPPPGFASSAQNPQQMEVPFPHLYPPDPSLQGYPSMGYIPPITATQNACAQEYGYQPVPGSFPGHQPFPIWPYLPGMPFPGFGYPHHNGIWRDSNSTANRGDNQETPYSGNKGEDKNCPQQYFQGNSRPNQTSPEKPRQSNSEDGEKTEDEVCAPRTVAVYGASNFEDEDIYKDYFVEYCDSEDEVEVEIDEEKEVVYITFSSSEVAEEVARECHIINEEEVEVTLVVAPKTDPTYPDKLLFENVPADVKKEHLVMYLKIVGGSKPEVVYGDELGVVLATFKQAAVPVSKCLLVEGLNEDADEDFVSLYFENKGGDVDKVEMLEDTDLGTRCLVYFSDSSALDRVLSRRQHRLKGRKLRVKHFFECLGTSGGSEDPRIEIPKPVHVSEEDRHKISFVERSSAARERLTSSLLATYARLTLDKGTIVMECTIRPDTLRARALVRTWSKQARKTLADYFSTIHVNEMKVDREIWPAVRQSVEVSEAANSEEAMLIELPEESAIVVVGYRDAAKILCEQTKITMRAAEEEHRDRRKVVEVTDANLKPFQLKLLQDVSFPRDTEKRNQDLRIDINGNEITFRGRREDVQRSQKEMQRRLSRVDSEKLTDMSTSRTDLLEYKETDDLVKKKLNSCTVIAAWEKDADGNVVVYAFSKTDVSKAATVIRKTLTEAVLKLNPESLDLLKTDEWEKMLEMLIREHPGKLFIVSCQETARILFTGTDDILPRAKNKVEQFMEENTIYSQLFQFSFSRQKLVSEYWREKLTSIENTLKKNKVQILLQNRNSRMLVRGTQPGLIMARGFLQEIEDQIVVRKETVTDPLQAKFLASVKSPKDLDALGREHCCVFSREQETAGLKVLSPLAQVKDETRDSAGQFKVEEQVPSLAAVKYRTTYCSVTVAAVHGDITQMKVDVIVNAANAKMNHIGGLAGDIVRKGGQIIQTDCYNRLKTTGALSEGDVLASLPGSLPCKAVFHAVGPVYNNGESGEDACLKRVVMNCLEMAKGVDYHSIAFPAISSGIFRFPVAQATRTIVLAVKTFVDSHPNHNIQNVYLCHTDHEGLQHFCVALQEVFEATSAGTLAQTTEDTFRNASGAEKTPSYALLPEKIAGQGARPRPWSSLSRNFPTEANETAVTVRKASSASRLPSSAPDVRIVQGEIAKQAVGTVSNGEEFQSAQSQLDGSAARPDTGSTGVPSRTLAPPDVDAPNDAILFEIMPTGLHFVVQQGDITAEAADAIVNSTNADLDLSQGAVANTLKRKCGPELESECSEKLPDMKQRGIAVTRAYRLMSKLIMHIDAQRFSSDWEAGIKLCLDEAEKHGIHSLAMPAFGTGAAFKMTPENSAEVILRAVTKFCESSPQSLRKIHVVIFEATMIAAFVRAVDSFSITVKKKGIFKKAKDVFLSAAARKTKSSVVDQKPRLVRVTNGTTGHNTVTVYVYAPNDNKADAAIEAFKDSVREKYETKAVQSDTLKCISGTQLEEVLDTFRQHDVDYELCQLNGQLNVRGQKTAVYSSMLKVNDILHAAELQRKDETLQQLQTAKLPDFWDTQSADDQVKSVQLFRGDGEFLQVEQNFMASTESAQRPRICEYAAKKRQLEKQNGVAIQNEKTLWHGTSADATDNINKNGFDRGYCGKNATKYGEGVYFAVDADYSLQTTYSPADAQGKRRVYQCKVLVGHSTRGRAKMKVLPKRHGDVLFDSATNDENSPGIYVIFNDTQAYPEYLILFQ
ncbi:hypothetical protein BaRGS_00012479 [Batillaria attramentaria]|uniref:Poly [ADP-ribose] polymerase n=1 Tax=Batillaria attramentaria TaxID=370345 RepID=A0ABD0LB14_9CAEN